MTLERSSFRNERPETKMKKDLCVSAPCGMLGFDAFHEPDFGKPVLTPYRANPTKPLILYK